MMQLFGSNTEVVDFLYYLQLHLVELILHLHKVRWRICRESLGHWRWDWPSETEPETNLPCTGRDCVIRLLRRDIALMNLLVKIAEEIAPTSSKTNPEWSKLEYTGSR
jgi:hypothetical protein